MLARASDSGGCDIPPPECLALHVAPRLAGAKTENGGFRVRARCPVCSSSRSLQISAGEHARLVWHCHGGCDRDVIRKALIVAGVPQSCLPARSDDPRDTIAAALAVMTRDRRGGDDTILRASLILRGFTSWPIGDELVELAREVGVCRSVAFECKRGGPLTSPGTASTKQTNARVVKQCWSRP